MPDDDELVDDLCAPCRDADHAHCRTELGCQCIGTWDVAERHIVLCQGLTGGDA